MDTTARLVAVVSSWELPRFAGLDFDTLDLVIRFAHTYNLDNRYNTYQFEDYNTAARVAGDIGLVAAYSLQDPEAPSLLLTLPL